MCIVLGMETKTPPNRRRPPRRTHPATEPISALSMRELGKLTVEQVSGIDHPVPVTSNGRPVAWLVPMSPGERRRAEMIAEGTLEPRRREDVEAWSPEPYPAQNESESTLSEILLAMREQERT